MKTIPALLAVILLAGLTGCRTAPSSVAARPVSVVINAPDGQRVTGHYVVDGVTNAVNTTAPVTLKMQARDVTYEFQRTAGEGEFRVALFVGGLCRTSTTSDQRQGVRGEFHHAAKK
ncbi:MAG: hypothetical protein K0Q55_3283, partial [Verrucomicrobia bacterium]|nr:hypothetical protein [Verrucomicrobiota bacterium]